MQVVVAHVSESPSSAARRLGVRTGSKPPESLFLSASPADFERWRVGLGDSVAWQPVQPALDTISERMRKPFVDWSDRLTEVHGRDEAWWFGTLSERNTLTDPFFTLICYLALLGERCLSDGSPHLVVCQTKGLMVDASHLLNGAGHDTRPPSWWAEIAIAARESVQRLAYSAFFVAHWAIQRRWLAFRSRGGGPRPQSGPGPFLYTFVEDVDVDTRGQGYRDRFLPGLAEELAARNLDPWRLPLLPGRRRMAARYRLMRARGSRFLVPEDWLRTSDYLHAWRACTRLRQMPQEFPPLEGLDMQGLGREERRRQSTAYPAAVAGLYKRLPARLAAAGFRPEYVFAWSENQVFDKALFMGSRESFPNAQLVGIQNAPFYSNLLNTFPTRLECSLGTSPDVVACSGPVPAEVLSARSGRALRTFPWCGLRYRYLRDLRQDADRERRGVLIALPYTIDAAVGLLEICRHARQQIPEATWYVKCHPRYDFERLRHVAGATSLEGLEPVTGAIGGWLDRATVVVTMGSGTALEAAARAVPVVIVASPTQVTLDPLVWFDDAPAPVYDVGALVARVETYLESSNRRAVDKLAAKVLEGWFAQVNHSVVDDLLDKVGHAVHEGKR